MAIFQDEYVTIIVSGIIFNPQFLLEHYKREFSKLEAEGYTIPELEFGFRDAISIMKNHFIEAYEKELGTYNRSLKENEGLPRKEWYDFPKPALENIKLDRFKVYDPNPIDYFLTRRISMADLEGAENTLDDFLSSRQLDVKHPDIDLPSENGKNPAFQINDKVLSKIDFIRLLNVLYELKAFKNEDGTIPHKKDVVNAFGKLVGLDIDKFHPDLNKAYEKSLEANSKFFELLKSKAVDLWNNKNYK